MQKARRGMPRRAWLIPFALQSANFTDNGEEYLDPPVFMGEWWVSILELSAESNRDAAVILVWSIRLEPAHPRDAAHVHRRLPEFLLERFLDFLHFDERKSHD